MIGAHHVLPFVASVCNLWLNYQYFIRLDLMWVVFGGVLYIPTNYIGTIYNGKPLYPYPGDWSNPWLSLSFYLIQPLLLFYIHRALVTFTKRVFPRNL